MNRVYRLVWCNAKHLLIVAGEFAHAQGKGGMSRQQKRRRTCHRRLLLASLLLLPFSGLASSIGAPSTGMTALRQNLSTLVARQAIVPPAPGAALPAGGQVIAGTVALQQNGNTLDIHQATDQAILDWQSFDIGAGATVNFLQPGADSVALNRVIGNNASAIYGHLNANGQVFLINPNGVYFARGAEVNVGGIVASTLDLSNADFLAGHDDFAGGSQAGIVNAGRITASHGGYVALLGSAVTNTGTVTTPGGTTAMGAGSGIDLALTGDSLLSFHVNRSALDALAQNGGVIAANGGTVVLSAQAKDALLQTVVNNTGIIRAETIAEHDGVIQLLGGDQGNVQVAGTLDASAPTGGSGGHIETSGQHVKVASDAVITTRAAQGSDGRWLIDPQDFTIAASGGDITGAALSSDLNAGNVTLQTAFNGAVNCNGAACGAGSAGNGDINVNDAVNWSQNTLTLSAYRNININAAMNGAGTAGLALQYGQGSSNGMTLGGSFANYYVNTPVNLAGTASFSTQLGSAGAVQNYQVVTNQQQLQAIGNGLKQNYVLGNNIATNGNFTPIGSDGATYQGAFDGLGHTIANLTVNDSGAIEAGLFGYTDGGAVLRDVNLTNESVTNNNPAGSYVGGLVGRASNTTIFNDTTAGAVGGTGGVPVNGTGGSVGGLAGETFNGGSLELSSSSATVSASGDSVGGLVGNANNNLVNVSATGNVSGVDYVGGLAGAINFGDSVTNGHASGAVTATGDQVGGLAGQAGGAGNVVVSNSSASGPVTGRNNVGGLVGFLTQGQIINSNAFDPNTQVLYNSGAAINQVETIIGANQVGGLVGSMGGSFSVVLNSYANQAELGDTNVGGLVGENSGGTIEYSHATGFAKAKVQAAGGLVGSNDSGGLIFASYAMGSAGAPPVGNTATSQYSPNDSGGIAGVNDNATISNSYSSGPVVLTNASAGGLVGLDVDHAVIENSIEMGPVYPVKDTISQGQIAGTADTTVTISGVYYLINGLTDQAAVGVVRGANPNGPPFLKEGRDFFRVGKPGFVDNSTFAGFDFTNIWMPTPNGETSPLLRTPIVVTGSRVYDGTAIVSASDLTAVNVGSGPFTVTPPGSSCPTTLCPSAYQPGPNVTVTGSATTAAVPNGPDAPDAGVHGFASVSGLALAGADADEYTLYTPANTPLAQGSFTITPRPVTVLGATMTYNGANQVPGSAFKLGNLAQSDSATLSGNAVLASKNAGSEPVIGLGNLGLNIVPWQHAGDYVLLGQDFGNVTVTPAALTIAGATAQDKTYDGTTAATITGATLSGVLGNDAVILVGGSNGSFASANAGNNIAVNASLTLSGADAGNYTLTQPVGLTANIAPRTVNLTGSRVYDGTTTIDGSLLTASNLVSGDSLTIGGTGILASENVGIESIANSSALNLNNANYTLVGGNDSITITPALLTVSGATAQNKIYDGNTAATITGATLTGVIGSDAVSLGNDTSGAFASVNVGSNLAVDTSMTLAGAAAGNYTLTQPSGLVANITPAPLTVTGATAQDKVYDGTTAATITGATLTGVIGSDAVSLGNDTSGAFASANVGSNLAVNTSMTLAGAAAGNYTLTQPSGLVANITPAPLTVTGATAQNKVYDGTTAATITGATLTGVIGGDAVSLSNETAGTFASANVGINIPVSTTMGLLGATAGDYTLTQPVGLAADITAPASSATSGGTGNGLLASNSAGTAALTNNGGVLGQTSGATVPLDPATSFLGAHNSGQSTAVDFSISGVNSSGLPYGMAATCASGKPIDPFAPPRASSCPQ